MKIHGVERVYSICPCGDKFTLLVGACGGGGIYDNFQEALNIVKYIEEADIKKLGHNNIEYSDFFQGTLFIVNNSIMVY